MFGHNRVVNLLLWVLAGAVQVLHRHLGWEVVSMDI